MRSSRSTLALVVLLLAVAGCDWIAGAPLAPPTCTELRVDVPIVNVAGDTVSTFTMVYPVCTPARKR